MQTLAERSANASSKQPVKVRFLDLSVKDEAERAELIGAMTAVLDHGRIVLGPEVAELERRVAKFCGRRHAVGVNTGTDALILGLKVLNIGSGDEVITTPLSWLATGSAVLLNGATPVFADIDETLNLDPAAIEPLITAKTKAILVVHFTGHLAPMAAIKAIAQRHGLLLIEDGAQAFGATLDGVPCGGFGDLACLSFNAMKILGALGDAGMVLTDDPDVAKRLDMLRHSGVVDREYCRELSHNCRLDTLQAAFLLKRLDRHPTVVERRRQLAARYARELAGIVDLPPSKPGYLDAVYTYPIRTSHRDALRDYLEGLGIETRIQHPLIMADQPAFQGKFRGASPRAARLVQEILCIPAHEKLSDAEQDFVIEAIKQFFGR
ncbi:MAG TPA: DegT/DnrJ/EryC1/StrS family aminotransferase [Xanthobacteraceae bacterium]|jgi:dTDP-4-amino-4,6-dideoxygalactose transaminase|nr:DegT/DnrJ/EryC1/StrS family aminotransferase [Xanthobacteraceae bacterium]